MNLTVIAFHPFSGRIRKVAYYACCLLGIFFSVKAHAGAPNQLNSEKKKVPIVCTVTDHLITIKNANTTIRITNALGIEISFSDHHESFPVTKGKASSFVSFIHLGNDTVSFTRKTANTKEINSKFGKGKTVQLVGVSSDGKLVCHLSFKAYEQFPNVILVQSSFKNSSQKNYAIQSYCMNHLSLHSPVNENKWWTFQGASYYWGQDFAFELPKSFHRENYMGLNDTRVGSGIPFIDVWNKKFGLALAYIGEHPRDLYLPVKAEKGEVQVAIKENNKKEVLKPNQILVSPQTAIIVHTRDFYDPLQTYSKLMKPFLPRFKEPASYAYQSEWCTWGYRQDFKPEEILRSLDHLKSLGIKSVILDDGWSLNHGDWIPNPAKFPGGDEEFRQFIRKIHEKGLKVWIWWLPGYIDSTSKLATQHPDWLVKNKDGSVHPSYALCPAYPPVQEHYKMLVEKFVADYKLDGLKLDFQEINSAPPCYNPAHHHKDSLASYDSTPALFKNIYQTAIRYNPNVLLEYCSCGIPPNIFHLPWINLAVTSDPGVQQITQRIKMYKALMGDHFPVLEEYCGVLAGPIYPLAIGAGGVPGTFSTNLNNDHEKWLDLYQKYQLSKGQYLNLYDIGFDYPEGHVIKKGQQAFYAFYTHPWKQEAKPATQIYRFGTEFDYKLDGQAEFKYPTENFSGELTLRGLDKNKEYRVVDYANHKDLGTVRGDKPFLNVSFDDYLLLEVSPIVN